MSSVIFRCNAGHINGYGHVMRCLSLAKAFRAYDHHDILFVLNSDEAFSRVNAEGFEVKALSEPYDDSFFELVCQHKPDILILDDRPPHPLELLLKVREYTRFMALLDSSKEQRMAMDAVYLPPVPAAKRVDWSNFSGSVRIGLEWVLTGPGFTPPAYREPIKPYRLLITMGGSDPWGYTKRLAPFVYETCEELGLALGVVVGPGFTERGKQISFLKNLQENIKIFDAPPKMSIAYDWCDFAIVPLCVSAYELARSAKPALYICPDEDYRQHAGVFVEHGFGRILDLPASDTKSYYTEQLKRFVDNNVESTSLRSVVAKLFLNDPAQMIASDILQLLRDKFAR